MNILVISVSLMTNFDKLATDSFCGILFREAYINRTTTTPSSDAMELGQYFEFKCTGALIREHPEDVSAAEKGKFFENVTLKYVEPQPGVTKKGEYNADYKRVFDQVALWPVFLQKYKITQKEISYEMKHEYKGLKLKGIADVLGEWKENRPVIVDLKYTAQIDNKWDDYGWGHQDIGILWNKMLQPIMYCYLYEQLNGIRPDFIFYVASSKDLKRRLFFIRISDTAIERMLGQVVYTNDMIEYHNATGWNPTQNYLNCLDCPLKETCEHCIRVPEIKEVNL